ncbi:MAG: phage portal protein [Planctomycetes bacterium]|nr:phage portal protein [Planctomycetota bacterium]
MAYRLQAFSDVGLTEASFKLALGEHETRTLPRLDKLWTYYRNALEPVAGAGAGSRAHWYAQPQEVGLPTRLTRPATSDDRLRTPRELVIENDIAWRIHAMVDFLFAKPIRFVSTARTQAVRQAVQSALDAIWESSGGIALLTDLALLGHVFGHADLLVRVTDTAHDFRRSAQRCGVQALEMLRLSPPVRIELIDPRRAVPFADTADFRRLSAYAIHFEREGHAPEQTGFLRSLLPGARRKRTTHTEFISADFHQTYEDERLLSAEETPWTQGRLPVVHIQNVSQPFHYAGVSEVEPLIPLQDELNTRLSDRAYRLAMQSFKMYLIKGFGSTDELSIGPGIMLSTDNPDASVQTFGGDAEAPSEDAHFEAVRNALDKLSGVPPLATGVVQGKVGNLSSAMALKVTLMGLLSRTARKQVTYGRGLAEASRLILAALHHLDILKTDEIDRGIRIDWPDPLPTDDREQVQTAETKIRIGVEKSRVLEELGYATTDDGVV